MDFTAGDCVFAAALECIKVALDLHLQRREDSLFPIINALDRNLASANALDRRRSVFIESLAEMEEYSRSRATISVRSLDKVVFTMNKSAAISESVVLGDLIDSIPKAGYDEDEIPVLVSSIFLGKTISFCKKKHKFSRIIEGTVQQIKGAVERLKETVDDYTGWLTSFIQYNKPIFSHLHQAADYLHIPALFELTSTALGDMRENSVEEISEWYAGLTIPPMLSPLGMQAFSTLFNLDLFA